MSQPRTEPSSENPFESPTDVPVDYQVRGPGICPYCGGADFNRPYFTHWGGYVGPWLLTHAVCRQCNRGFNARSGTSNLLNIALYQIGSVALVLAALAAFFFLVIQK